MPIDASEVKLYLSASGASLGGARTSTLAGANLFGSITAVQAEAGRVDYKCVYIENADAEIALNEAVFLVQSDSSSAHTSLAVGVGTSPVNGVEQVVTGETMAPQGVSFGSTANLGEIPPLGRRAVWIRRTTTAGASARTTDAATLRVTGNYSESGTEEPDTFFDSVTRIGTEPDRSGRAMVVSLHGSGGQNYTTGTRYEAECSGDMAFDIHTKFLFSTVSSTTQPSNAYLLRPIDAYDTGSERRESMWLGFLNMPDNVVRLITERRLDALMAWASANLPELPGKRCLTGGSMGGWGSNTYGLRRPNIFAAIYPDRPRWTPKGDRVAISDYALGGIASVSNTPGANLSEADGGGKYADYVDMIALVSDTSKKIPWVGWCVGRNDGYMPFADHVAAVAALRAAKRGFAFAWNDGNHSTGSILSQITQSYPYGTFTIGVGYPLFTEHSGDQDPAVDLVGGINVGLSFRNVVESATGWSCEVTSILGPRTVKVEPLSDVFTAPVAAKLVTIPAANVWVPVSFAA